MSIAELNENLTAIETYFNIAGGIPLVGILSGGLRIVAGKVQLVAGIVLAFAKSNSEKHQDPKKRTYEDWSKEGPHYIKHGVLNILRGIGEVVIGETIVGSLFLLAIQMLTNQFAPVVPYKKPEERLVTT